MSNHAISQIFAALDAFNAEVTIYRTTYRFAEDAERWSCTLTLSSDGTDIKIRKTGTTWDEALLSAFDNFETLTKSSAVNAVLNLPLLAAPANTEDAPF